MSFFNSFRRKPADEFDTAEVSQAVTRRRLTWGFSFSAKRRPSVPWDLSKLESENDNRPKGDTLQAVESSTYPAHQTSRASENASQLQSAPEDEAHRLKSEARGRSPRSVKSLSSLRLRSRSRSPKSSSSSAKGFLSRAAEAIRAPTSLFYKEPAGEDAVRPLVQDLSPARSVQSKKSVRFLMGKSLPVTAQSSPGDVPDQTLPSLPPVRVSSPTLVAIEVDDPSLSALRPPKTLSILGLGAKAAASVEDDGLLGPPAVPATGHDQQLMVEKSSKSAADPFDDSAASEYSLQFAEPHILNAIRFQKDRRKGSSLSLAKAFAGSAELRMCSGSEGDCGACLDPSNPFSDVNVTGMDNGDQPVSEAVATNTLETVNLPLRLRESSNSSARTNVGEPRGGASAEQDLDRGSETGPSTSPRNRAGDGEVTRGPQSLVPHLDKSSSSISSGTKAARQPSLSSATLSPQHNLSVEDCTARLDRLKISDDSSKASMAQKSTPIPTADGTAATVVQSTTEPASDSPTRRAFRFENKTQTSPGDQPGDHVDTSHEVEADDAYPKHSERALELPGPLRTDTWSILTPTGQASILLYYIKYPAQKHRPDDWPWDEPCSNVEFKSPRGRRLMRDEYRDQHGYSPDDSPSGFDCIESAVRTMVRGFYYNGECRLHLLAQTGGLYYFLRRYGVHPSKKPAKDTQALTPLQIGQIACSAIHRSADRYRPHDIRELYHSLMLIYEEYYWDNGLGEFRWDPIYVPPRPCELEQYGHELLDLQNGREHYDVDWKHDSEPEWGVCSCWVCYGDGPKNLQHYHLGDEWSWDDFRLYHHDLDEDSSEWTHSYFEYTLEDEERETDRYRTYKIADANDQNHVHGDNHADEAKDVEEDDMEEHVEGDLQEHVEDDDDVEEAGDGGVAFPGCSS